MTVSLPAGPMARDFFRDLLDNPNDMTYTADLTGVINAVNHAG